jgi:PAS domain-containing protein
MTTQITLLLSVIGALGLLGVGWQFRTWALRRQRQIDTQFKTREAVLHQESAFFKGLVESSPDATLIVDEAGTIQIVNTQAERLFGYDCQRRLNIDPPCRSKFDPGRVAGFQIGNCG